MNVHKRYKTIFIIKSTLVLFVLKVNTHAFNNCREFFFIDSKFRLEPIVNFFK